MTSIDRGDEIHGYAPLDLSSANTKLYKVTANLFLSSFIGKLGAYSQGALSIVPKNAAGVPITDLTAALVDRDPTTATVEELKEWQALLGYIGAFPDTNGNKIPDMPVLYKAPLGRIRAVSSGAIAPDDGEPLVRRN